MPDYPEANPYAPTGNIGPHTADNPGRYAEAARRVGNRYSPDTDRDHNAWLDEAACKGLSPSIFFPELEPGQPLETYAHRYDQARAICASCPVIDQCAVEMFRSDLAFGAHGFGAGMEPDERKKSKLRSCPGCGQPFAGRKRQKWCDRPECQYKARRQGAQTRDIARVQ